MIKLGHQGTLFKGVPFPELGDKILYTSRNTLLILGLQLYLMLTFSCFYDNPMTYSGSSCDGEEYFGEESSEQRPL